MKLERPGVNVWQSAEDGEKGIDEDEKEETQNVSLAYELISCLATCRYVSDRCQHIRLEVWSTAVNNFTLTMNF